MLALISEIINFGIVNKIPSDTIAKAIVDKLKEYNFENGDKALLEAIHREGDICQ